MQKKKQKIEKMKKKSRKFYANNLIEKDLR